MSFIKKTQAEVAKMSDDEAEDYATAKAAHEAAENKTAIDAAIKTMREEVEKSNAEAVKVLNENIAKLQKANDESLEILKKQGEELAKKQSGGFGSIRVQELKDELKIIQTKSTEGLQGQKVQLKTFSGDDAMGVENFPNVAGTGTITGAVSTILAYFSQVIPGIFKTPIPTSNILDYCDVMPLAGEQLVSISETRTVNMSVTLEGVAKPVSKASWSALSVPAVPVATLFKTTDQMRKFFAVFVNSFYNTLVAFMNKIIPERVISVINSSATAFTPVAAQEIYTEPNDFDAIVQMIASLVKLGYKPNVAKVSIFTYAAMKTLKSAEDGQYMLANNGSINILDSTISFGDIKVKLDTDTSFGNDDVLVGDLMAVKVGLDGSIAYYEAYVGADFETNKKSHLIEKYVAVNVPIAVRTGIIKDTLTNVKTLITAA